MSGIAKASPVFADLTTSEDQGDKNTATAAAWVFWILAELHDMIRPRRRK
jgi:hypothetical protein